MDPCPKFSAFEGLLNGMAYRGMEIMEPTLGRGYAGSLK